MIKLQLNGIEYELDPKKYTASIIGSKEAKPLADIIIPKSVQKGKHEYIITCIKTSSFNNSPIKTLKFAEDSKLLRIESYSFCDSSVESISLPSSVEEIQDGWCLNANKLITIIVAPSNKNFSFINNTMLVSKSNKDVQFYDTILFVRSDISHVVIPSFIKRMSLCIFSDYHLLKEVLFPDDSKIEEIPRNSFSFSSLTRITIPSSVVQIRGSAFLECHQLKTVLFQENSQLKKIEKMLSIIHSLNT